MAGLGRRSHYRKHLTDSVLNDYPEPNYPFERVAKILGTRGGNMFDVLVSPAPGDDDGDDDGAAARRSPEPRLAILPTKFRKLVWVKRGDFVIVECGDVVDDENDEREETTKEPSRRRVPDKKGGVRYIVQHVLYKDQIRHLRTKGLWPEVFREDVENDGPTTTTERDDEKDETRRANGASSNEHDEKNDASSTDDDDGGGVFLRNDYLNDDDLMLTSNANRTATLMVDESSDESSDEEEE